VANQCCQTSELGDSGIRASIEHHDEFPIAVHAL